MDKIVYIYGLHNGDDIIRYVGKTYTLEKRLKEHIKHSIKKKTHKDFWILKELSNGNAIKMVILELTDGINWCEKEIYWIDQFKNLCNITAGGLGGSNLQYKLSYDETIKIIHPLQLKSKKEYLDFYKKGLIPNFISPYPKNSIYLKKDWISWGHFLGHNRISDNNKSLKFYSYEDASNYVKKLKFTRYKYWIEYTKSELFPDFLTKRPERYYLNKGWVDHKKFFGDEYKNDKDLKEFISYIEASKIIKEYKFPNSKRFIEFIKTNRDLKIPTTPDRIYKNSGWVNWVTFLT